jgi:hypothetical protein
VSRMKEVKTSAEVVYQFMDEFVDAVSRLQGMLEAAEKHG